MQSDTRAQHHLSQPMSTAMTAGLSGKEKKLKDYAFQHWLKKSVRVQYIGLACGAYLTASFYWYAQPVASDHYQSLFRDVLSC